MQPSNVSWNRYAKKYDMLMTYNPFYQQLNAEVLERTKKWSLQSGDLIVDLAGGTGNYSIALAQQFPEANIIHVDGDKGMCQEAQEKKENLDLRNLNVELKDVDEIEFEPESLDALICIHALYTFPDPIKILNKAHQWLKPKGQAIFVNPGRIVNVLDWQVAIGWQMIMKYGILKTISIMQEGKEVSYQNKQVSKLQKNGTYWTHSHQEFNDAIKNAGFTILESRLCFRKISDMAVVCK